MVNGETTDVESMDVGVPVPYHTAGGHRKIHQGSEDRAARSQDLSLPLPPLNQLRSVYISRT